MTGLSFALCHCVPERNQRGDDCSSMFVITSRGVADASGSSTKRVLCEPPLSFFLLESVLEVGGGELRSRSRAPPPASSGGSPGRVWTPLRFPKGEIHSIGDFPTGMRAELLTQEHRSIPRSPLIAGAFHRRPRSEPIRGSVTGAVAR